MSPYLLREVRGRMEIRKLSIVVPVYNEAATVGPLFERLAAVSFPIEREILAVDDGSNDGSSELLERLADAGVIRLLVHSQNGGKGVAIQTALRHVAGDVIVIQDADIELDPADLPSLLVPILSGESRVCFGSRFLNGVSWSVRRRPTYWANRLLNACSNLLNGIRITDFNTCYKMIATDVLRRLSLSERGFAMEPEITAKLTRLGYAIAECPVHYRPRSQAEGKKIRAKDLLAYLSAMARYRFWRPDREAAHEPIPVGPELPVGVAGAAD